MANKFRGEAEFSFMRTVEGVEGEQKATFKLVYDANALCEIESVTGMGMMELAETFSNPAKMSMTTMRAILYGGLQRHHPSTNEREGLINAGDILSDAGAEAIVEAMGTAFGAAFKSAGGKAKGGRATKS